MKLSVRYAAWLLNVPVEKIYHWINQNSIPYANIEDHYLFNRVELLEWATMMKLPFSTEVFTQNKSEDGETTAFLDALKIGGVLFFVPGCNLEDISMAIIKSLSLPKDTDYAFLAHILMASNSLGYNAIGNGIAIPQVRNPMVQHVDNSFVTLCYMEHPFELNATDGLPIHAVFTIVSTSIHKHLYLLSRLICLLGFQEIKDALIRKMPEQELFQLLSKMEKKLMVNAKESPPPT